MVGELKYGEINEYEIHPEDFGLTMVSNRALRVETPEQSRAMLMGVLDNLASPARDIVMLNAGVALYAANVSANMGEGIELARKTLASGAAKVKLTQLVELSRALAT
jgi:anthranilate phosphoribosyltransferase